MSDGQLRLIYQDQQVLVVHKPAGWTIYAEDGVPKSRQLLAVCQEMLMEQIHPVHRLDKGTCGLVVFAGAGRWARELQEQFQRRKIKKTYLALVEGDLKKAQKFDQPLREKGKGEQSAVTAIKPLMFGALGDSAVTLLELKPETGRFHQLRKHCKLLKHPIVGDESYGGTTIFSKDEANELNKRLMLSAVGISFTHPKTDKELIFRDEPDADFMQNLRILGIKYVP